MLGSAVYIVVCRLLELMVLLARGDRANELEILVLRHELSIVRRQVNRPRVQPHDRLLLAAFTRILPRQAWNALFVQPRHSCPGTADSWLATRPTHTDLPAGRRSALICAS